MLWPTSTASPTNSSSDGNIAPGVGAPSTMASVMPVSALMNGGIR
jgi:hypothetical protein